MSHLLNEEIVAARRQRAAGLERIHLQTSALIDALAQVAGSPLSFNKPQALQPLLEELKTFNGRVQRKLNLFRNGMVTVCVAGTEKAGKTTMLKCLTGIEDLPTAPERCTSVSSEIVYTEQTPAIDIHYYTAAQLLELVVGLWKYLHDAPGIWALSPAALAQNPPTNLRDFSACALPGESALNRESRLKYQSALKQLHAIKNAFLKHSHLLGNTETGIALSELKRFVSHRTESVQEISDNQCLIRKVVIHAPFKGGSPALRLCDTPGVDDPNPNAQMLTFRAIAEEADFLVVADHAVNPDITESLATFINNVGRLDPDSPLRERIVMLINWKKRLYDADGSKANLRKKKVQEQGIFKDIQGPLDVTEEAELNAFMEHINERLSQELPTLDGQLITRLEDEFRSLQSRVRLEVYDVVVTQAPPLPENYELILHNKYQTWFTSYLDSLRAGLNDLTLHSTELPEIGDIKAKIDAILLDAYDKMDQWVQKNANETICNDLLRALKDPQEQLMPRISYEMTQTVEQLAGCIETISPAIQRQVKSVIVHAMGERIAGALLQGDSDADGLTALSRLMENAAERQENDAAVCFIAASLREFASLDAQMRYVMRFEMRPCLNIVDPFRWLATRKDSMLSRVLPLLDESDSAQQTCKSWLQNAIRPGAGSAACEHAQFLSFVTQASFFILRSILISHAGQMQTLVDDFLAQASQTLGTQPSSHDGWFRGLQVYKNRILAEDYAGLEARSQEAEAFKQLQATLNNALS